MNPSISGVLLVKRIEDIDLYELFDCTATDGYNGFYLVSHLSMNPNEKAREPKRDYKVFPYHEPALKFQALETATQACYGGPAK